MKCAGAALLMAAVAGQQGGCPPPQAPPLVVPPEEPGYIGSVGCSACHANITSTHSRTGHAQALRPVLDGAPVYPAGPGVPNPPAGFDFSQMSYVSGGYEKAARFVDSDGFVLTTGTTGVNTQYQQAVGAVGIPAGFVPFLPAQTTPLPFEFDQFFRRTTGPLPLAENGGMRQDGRPGIEGTWFEPGVQCEACHGPGSQHPADPSGGTIQLDADSQSCQRCHAGTGNPNVITAAGGLVPGFQQVNELAASPHRSFSCNICHNPHASVFVDRAAAIRNECQVCHSEMNMALHEGKVFVRGDYVETLTCTSCHMPPLVETFALIDAPLTNGNTARFGDTRSHIFRLDPSPGSLAQMFTPDGTQIAEDAQGEAGISTCYVCQRCHGQGVFAFPPNQGCAFGTDIHGP